jgi:photosystem II stability/assembly factor-like uncharacterized protein
VLEVSIRVRAVLAGVLAAWLLAGVARADVAPELAAAIAQTRAAYPRLVVIQSGDRYLARVDDAELAALVERIAAGQWDASTEAATWVVLEGFARDQGPAAAYGRTLTSRVAGSAAAGGNVEALRGISRILMRFLDDESHAYSILAQGLLSEKVRCGAASLGDDELVRSITAKVNPDRAFKLAGTDGTVADRYDLHRRADLFSVAASGERVAAAGYFGTVIVSRDGGQSWDAPNTGTDEPLYAVALGPGDEIWAAGRAGVVIRSEDGGRSFTRRATPFDRHVFGLYASGPGSVLAVGDYGLQLRTHDGGAHWTCIPREQDVILGRIARAGDDAMVAGEFGTLERMPAGLPPGRRATLAGVPEDFYVFDVWLDAGGTLGVAVGLSGAIVRSEDGGASWVRVATPFTQDLFGVGGSGSRVVVAGEGGLLLVSEDGGKTFAAAASPPLPVTLTDVEFADAKRAFAVGPRGLVLRSDDGGASFRVLRGGNGP